MIDVTWLAEAATVVTVLLAKTVLLSELLPSFVDFFFFCMNKHKENKHKELQTHVQLHSYDLAGKTDVVAMAPNALGSAAMKGYRLFRKDVLERQGGGVPLYERAAGMHRTLPGHG